jgi:hypothetical protein
VRIAALAGLAVTSLRHSARGPALGDAGAAEGLPALPTVKFLVEFDEHAAAAPVRELADLICRSAGRELGSALRPILDRFFFCPPSDLRMRARPGPRR